MMSIFLLNGCRQRNQSYYLHNGKWVKMLSREETITVKNGQAETFTVWRTVHGNILQTDQTTQTAYAKSRAWDGKEVASLLASDSSDEGQKIGRSGHSRQRNKH